MKEPQTKQIHFKGHADAFLVHHGHATGILTPGGNIGQNLLGRVSCDLCLYCKVRFWPIPAVKGLLLVVTAFQLFLGAYIVDPHFETVVTG